MHNHISRRAFFIGAVRAGATGLAATSLSRTGVFGSIAVAQSQPRLRLNLPPYPFFDNLRTVMTEDLDRLDQLVSAYARTTPLGGHDPIDFLFPLILKIWENINTDTKKLQNPNPWGCLPWATWIIARLGGWSGYTSQRPPGMPTLVHGLRQFESIFLGWKLALGRLVYTR